MHPEVTNEKIDIIFRCVICLDVNIGGLYSKSSGPHRNMFYCEDIRICC